MGWDASPQTVTLPTTWVSQVGFVFTLCRTVFFVRCPKGMCCWHTIQSQVLENLWWLEGPLAWSAPVWCSANLERQKASRLLNKSFCCYVPPWLILALACWNMELGTTCKNRVPHLQTDRVKPQTNTLWLESSALSRPELFYPQRCGTNFQSCVRCGTPPFLVSQPPLQLFGFSRPSRDPTTEFTPSKPTTTCQSTFQFSQVH
jgi:hypothetical protein